MLQDWLGTGMLTQQRSCLLQNSKADSRLRGNDTFSSREY